MGFTPFLVALQFLTIFPIQLKALPNDQTLGRSLLYYPLVGLLIGLLLSALAWLGSNLPINLQAALILTGWVIMTGGLHLDGLADSADAWIGGLGDRAKTLAIMKDPCCGPAAVVTLVLVLLVKFTALAHLLTLEHWAALVLTPVLGRTALVLLFLTTPYVRKQGLGSLLARHLPRNTSGAVVISTWVIVCLLLGVNGVKSLLMVASSFFILRALMLRRIGGATGDTAGALVEITEMVMLLAIAGVPLQG